MRWPGWVGVVCLASLVGCGGDDDGASADAAPPELFDVALDVRRDVDVLFVIDDSGTMADEQGALAAAMPTFIDSLTSGGDLPDLHLGVVSSNLGTAPQSSGGPFCAGEGDEGILQVAEGCTPLIDGARFISDVADPETGERVINHAGDLAAQFGCMAQLGTDGCGYEQHLESMKRALANEVDNAGFLRPEANLVVVILADEDDCSVFDRDMFDASQDDASEPLGELSSFRCFEFGTTCEGVAPEDEREAGARTGCVPDDESPYVEKVSTYVDALTGLKAPHKLTVATIVGAAAPVAVGTDPNNGDIYVNPVCIVCPPGVDTCPTNPAEPDAAVVVAFPAIRLQAFSGAFGGRGSAHDICNKDGDGAVDFQSSLGDIALAVRDAALTRCLGDDLPADPICEVVEETESGSTDIPPCGGDDVPCYSFAEAPECADAGSETALVIERGDGSAPSDATVSLRCAR